MKSVITSAAKCWGVMPMFISFTYAFLYLRVGGKQCVCVIGLKNLCPFNRH